MSRDKQIEELADAIYTNCPACLLTEEAEMIARFVVEKQGYRKQGEPISCGHEKGGEWIAHRDPLDICATEFVCSDCRESFCSSELTDDEFLDMMKYCPNCGARMKGGDNDA